MNNTTRETLSALLDDEAEELELRRVLRELEADATRPRGVDGVNPNALAGDDLVATWYRYNLVRTALQGVPVHEAPDFLAGLNAALDDEAPLELRPTGGLRKAGASFAVAASVALAVVFGGQQIAALKDAGEGDRVASLPVGVVNTVGAVPVQASYGTRSVPTLEPADRTAYQELARQRLRRYSQEHAEHASLNTPQGMVPFARVPVIER
jgi:sigma-E factor negative regulatory protein RseA